LSYLLLKLAPRLLIDRGSFSSDWIHQKHFVGVVQQAGRPFLKLRLVHEGAVIRRVENEDLQLAIRSALTENCSVLVAHSFTVCEANRAPAAPAQSVDE
jgi:hypothetical protein